MNRRRRDDPSPVADLFLPAGLLLAAALLRLPGLTRSLGHDEVYTRVIFASRPWLDIFTAYHLPNNHILHTLCVRAMAALGEAEWLLRLPAWLAGVLAVPVLYGFGRRLTGSAGAGALAAALLAVSSVHIAFSQSARGYTLLTLLCLVQARALWTAIDQLRADADPPDHEALPWVLSALAGSLAVLTLPSATLFVGACAFATAGLIRLHLPAARWLRARVPLLLSTAAVVAVAGVVYVPRIDDLYSHAERFGVPLSLTTWPGFVADVWGGVGPQRAGLAAAALAAVGVSWLLVTRRGAGVYLASLLGLPLVFSLAVSTGGQPRVYAYLLPFACVAVAVPAEALRRWLRTRLPGDVPWQGVAALLVAAPLVAAFGRWPAAPPETGYRDAGRWVRDETAPGDLVVVPYIVDSAVGYYAGGATVQRLRQAVDGGLRRLWFVTRPGTPRFDLDDLMLATNLTTEAAEHVDTHRDWRFPPGGFLAARQFDLTAVWRTRQDPQAVDLGDLAHADAWRLFMRTATDSTTWSAGARADGAAALRVHVPSGAAVLHGERTFVAPQDGIVLLAYAKHGDGYASLFRAGGDEPRALQMARALSGGTEVRVDGQVWYDELYLLPVDGGDELGVYVTAEGDLDLAAWAVYFVGL